MTIIKAVPDQYEDVRSFYHSLIDAMEGSVVYVGWQKDIYPAPEFLEGSISRGELYIVLEADQIVGAMVCNHDSNESYPGSVWQIEAKGDEVLLIHALGVHPDHARKGYAKAMVRKAIELARETGMKAIRLDVLENNYPAENLYIGFGFQYRDTLKMYYEDTGWTNFKLFEYVI